jgi:hypothetical protein
MSPFRAGRLGLFGTICLCLFAACALVGGCAGPSQKSATDTIIREVLGQNVSMVSAGWSVDAAQLSLQSQIYVRKMDYLISIMVDPAWSITTEDADRLLRASWPGLDSTKIDDAAALAAVIVEEVKRQTAPDSLTAPLYTSWLDALTRYSSALIEAKAAIARQDGSALSTSLAKIGNVEKTLSSLLSEHLTGLMDLPILPTTEQALTKREQAYVVRLQVADDSLAMPFARIQKAVEEDTSDSPGQIVSPLAAEVLQIRNVCDWWTYGIAPSDRLLEVGSLWDSVMSHARQAMDLLDQAAAHDPDATAKIRVMLRLVVMETRSVRAELSQFIPSKFNEPVLPGYAAVPALSPRLCG